MIEFVPQLGAPVLATLLVAQHAAFGEAGEHRGDFGRFLPNYVGQVGRGEGQLGAAARYQVVEALGRDALVGGGEAVEELFYVGFDQALVAIVVSVSGEADLSLTPGLLRQAQDIASPRGRGGQVPLPLGAVC